MSPFLSTSRRTEARLGLLDRASSGSVPGSAVRLLLGERLFVLLEERFGFFSQFLRRIDALSKSLLRRFNLFDLLRRVGHGYALCRALDIRQADSGCPPCFAPNSTKQSRGACLRAFARPITRIQRELRTMSTLVISTCGLGRARKAPAVRQRCY